MKLCYVLKHRKVKISIAVEKLRSGMKSVTISLGKRLLNQLKSSVVE
ncbi:MAG: hypothetical protein QXT86_13055 [Archaeoglobaceae archaeon]